MYAELIILLIYFFIGATGILFLFSLLYKENSKKWKIISISSLTGLILGVCFYFGLLIYALYAGI